MLANACWPLQGDAKHREIVQITPLVPHQGFTSDCGVHTVIYFAGLFFQTDRFIAALEPGRRLVFAEDLVLNTRKHMLEWSTQVVNGYDVGLGEFFAQLRLIPDHFQSQFQVALQDGEWAAQQNVPKGIAKVRTNSLVRTARLPDLRFLQL